MGVILKSSRVVKPAEATWNGVMPLSELDQISVITLSSHLYFYDKPATEDEWVANNKIMDTLSESLSRALVLFYPLAGRLGWIGGGRLKLECNAMGAELIEVESSMKVTDYGDFYSARQKFQDLLPFMDYYRKPIKDLPVLAVQVTRFACGGICLGISMSHVVVDGRSAFHFTNEWARLARGVGDQPEAAPFLDRRLLIKQEEDANDHDDDDHVVVKGFLKNNQEEEGEVVGDEHATNYFTQLRLDHEATSWGKQVAPTFVVLTKELIDKLKEVANNCNNNNNGHSCRPYSRFEVIAAHVWRCVCRARELNNEDITNLTVVVDARDRIVPRLPSSYFGNAIVDVNASNNARDLLSNPLSCACKLLREAIKKVTHEYIMEKIKFFRNRNSLSKFQDIDDRGIVEGPGHGHRDVYVVSWLNLASRARCIDFGWGKEIHMGPPLVQACHGDVQLSPYQNDGSVVVSVCLQSKEKDKFMDHVYIT